MSVRIGEAQIKVTLDLSEAKRQQEASRRSNEKIERQKKDVVKKIVREERDAGKTEASRRSILDEYLARKAGSVAKRGAAGVAPALVAAGAARGLGPAGVAVARAAGVAAVTYGAVRVGAEAAISGLEALKASIPEMVQQLPIIGEFAKDIRLFAQQLDALEANVQAALSAMGSTKDYALATTRLSGFTPGISAIGGQYKVDQEASRYETQLQKNFKRWKRDDVAAGVGAALGEFFKDQAR